MLVNECYSIKCLELDEREHGKHESYCYTKKSPGTQSIWVTWASNKTVDGV